jgi:hypothetical protein
MPAPPAEAEMPATRLSLRRDRQRWRGVRPLARAVRGREADVVSTQSLRDAWTQSRRPGSRLPPPRRRFGAAFVDLAQARAARPTRAEADRDDGRGSLLSSRCSGAALRGPAPARPRPVALRETPDATPALSSPECGPELLAQPWAASRDGRLAASCAETQPSLRRTGTAKAWRQASRGERLGAVARCCRINAAPSAGRGLSSWTQNTTPTQLWAASRVPPTRSRDAWRRD